MDQDTAHNHMKNKLNIVFIILLLIMMVSIFLKVLLYEDGAHNRNDIIFENEYYNNGDDRDIVSQKINIVGLPEPDLFPPTPLEKIAIRDKWSRPRALIEGTVKYGRIEGDGDYHFVVEDANKNKVICEIIPQLKMDRPKVGQIIYVWGIVRWDRQHRWGELHPVIGWKLK